MVPGGSQASKWQVKKCILLVKKTSKWVWIALGSSELSQEAAGPSSSTPLKDSTPTNDVCDNINNVDEEENMDHEAGDKVVQIGEIVDEKDIVESSDC